MPSNHEPLAVVPVDGTVTRAYAFIMLAPVSVTNLFAGLCRITCISDCLVGVLNLAYRYTHSMGCTVPPDASSSTLYRTRNGWSSTALCSATTLDGWCN